MQNIIKKLQKGKNLTCEESRKMQKQIISGKVNKLEIINIFKLFDKKEMISDEFLGIVEETRKSMIPVKVNSECLDNCGTGGDSLGTFNISTVSSIICASCGIPVAKHGNRAASSKCGSADVLEELGVKIDLNEEESKRCLENCGIVFMFAQNFHPALKYVKEARVEYGKRTYFNILGPMLNPAGAKYQLIGVSDERKIDIIGNTLLKSGSKRVIIVCGKNGMDEISIDGDTIVADFQHNHKVAKYKINPKNFGLGVYDIKKIKGGDKEENAKIFLDILEGKASEAQKNAVLLNSAYGILVFGFVENIEEGIEIAKKQIESGKALAKLKEFIKVSNSV